MQQTPTIGIIGGSGLYHMSGLVDIRQLDVDTPFGDQVPQSLQEPWMEYTCIPRSTWNWASHLTLRQFPSVPNIYALKSIGVERIVSISACGLAA